MDTETEMDLYLKMYWSANSFAMDALFKKYSCAKDLFNHSHAQL